VKQVRVQQVLYSQLTVEAAIYRLAGKCSSTLRRDGEEWIVDLDPHEHGPTTEECARLFAVELNDQSLRSQIAEQTSRLKDLLLANAFSASSLIQTDDRSQGQASHSV